MEHPSQGQVYKRALSKLPARVFESPAIDPRQVQPIGQSRTPKPWKIPDYFHFPAGSVTARNEVSENFPFHTPKISQ
jgi:hypothetical protein